VSHHTDLAANLRAENQALREFHAILLNEQACLVDSDVDALLQITQLKSDKIDLLAELEAARSRHLHELGFDAGREGAADWLSRYSGTARADLAPLWDELVELATQVRALNESNGALISARMSHNQAALAALQSTARAQTLYGRDGQSDLGSRPRELGRA